MPLKERLRAKSPRSSLSPFFQMLIVIHVGYHIASCMKGNFTNTLLFRETESQNTIMLYNIFLFFAECVGMTVAAPLARRRGCVFCMRLGLAVHMCMQAAFFILLERITAVMPLMALLNGLSVGYYWMAYYTDVSEFSQDENRDRAIGVMGVYTSAVTLIMRGHLRHAGLRRLPPDVRGVRRGVLRRASLFKPPRRTSHPGAAGKPQAGGAAPRRARARLAF